MAVVMSLAMLRVPLASAAEPPRELQPARDVSIDAVLADARSRGLDRLPFAQSVQAVATLPALLGKPYAAGTLDGSPEAESLQTSLAGFDCVTYAETVLALTRTLARHGDARTFATELAALRYRNGQAAYCERLHYFTDWIRSNAARGAVEDVTAAVAGDPSALAFHALPSGVDFMSRHAAKLRALADSAPRRQCIAEAEHALSRSLPHDVAGMAGVAYLDTAHLATAGERLQGGDLLALVAETPGLDVIHVGIVLDGIDGGPRRFAHASSRAGHVAIAEDLQAWLAASPRALGAVVIRPLPPR